MMKSRHKVTFFTREQCSLCDAAWFVVKKLHVRFDFDLEKVDITDANQTALFSLYCHDIPVIHFNGKEAFRHRVSERKLRQLLESEGVLKR